MLCVESMLAVALFHSSSIGASSIIRYHSEFHKPISPCPVLSVLACGVDAVVIPSLACFTIRVLNEPHPVFMWRRFPFPPYKSCCFTLTPWHFRQGVDAVAEIQSSGPPVTADMPRQYSPLPHSYYHLM
ncbi:hypothetical protein M440DRAFT_1074288 [Trichoderma longibrachiatum ATCC 18648]|uniref:Uncharacterized protein n=1 Tax=Trichoderma longibrachiatum ATCC 18648 TaxID=983965 RepID=A0A2T4BUZ1_TRILO|nr:hypothetical protein M440DRAFT_1074288 [Trichoderma longibrachiatum ATCC 18648]